MQLIGMLDSPYVRRVAVSLQFLGLSVEHKALSVFRTFEQFSAINPVVKAPTLVCDDGTVLMDSTLILEYVQSLAGKSLMPSSASECQHALRLIGLGLAVCEKAVQIVYERLRPQEKQHEPWFTRVAGQLQVACGALESELPRKLPAPGDRSITQAHITSAVAWYFTKAVVPDVLQTSKFEALNELSNRMERLPEFAAAPHGLGTLQNPH